MSLRVSLGAFVVNFTFVELTTEEFLGLDAQKLPGSDRGVDLEFWQLLGVAENAKKWCLRVRWGL